jgi:Protein of unknown function (DUF2975)
MQMSQLDTQRRWFNFMDKAFWLLWIAFPITFGVIVWIILDPHTYQTGLTAAQITCLGDFKTPLTYSPLGKFAFWSNFVFDFVFYACLLFILHSTIHRFARGNIFDGHTLRNMQWLGVILIGYPIFKFLTVYTMAEILRATGDAAESFGNFFDVGPIAVGVFIMSIKFVLQNAMTLKSENDLTI